MDATLVLSGPGAVEPTTVGLSGDRLTVGRLPELNDIALEPDPEHLVTRTEHCAFERSGSTWSIVDGGSVNGTFVRRAGELKRVEGRLPLRDGDVVCVLGSMDHQEGARYFELEYETTADSQATRAAPEPDATEECLSYDADEARLVLVARGERHELHIRAQAHKLVAYMRYAREGGPIKTEDAPLDTNPLAGMTESSAAMAHLDEAVLAARGIVLRYGLFYGAHNDGLVEPVRKRQFPIVGEGSGYASWIHLDDAAAATVLALEHDGPAVYNVVDDEPAPVREWLPVLADALGAKPPRHFPVWLARLFAGDVAVMMGTEVRGSSNEKARRELGWKLRYPTWRRGFAQVYCRAEEPEEQMARAA